MKENLRKNKQKGVTLVALVVTIVVLLILAGITITALFSENGIIKKAQEAKNATEKDQIDTANGINSLIDQMNEQLGVEKTYSITADKDVVTKIAKKTIKVKDVKGNTITLPKGFRIKLNEGTIEKTTVQQGIVISDSADDTVQGNEFVWIPIGKVIKDDGSESNEIKLGRYNFNASTGAPQEVQLATDYQSETKLIPDNYSSSDITDKDGNQAGTQELATTRNGNVSSGTDSLNATAKDLAGFVDSVAKNGGYYIGRYEASCEAIQRETAIEYKLVSKQSNINAEDDTFVKPTTGGQIKLWNGIKQIDAALESRKMYDDADGNIGVKSDLVNSYAWDTAIVYIQEMGNANFANKNNTDVGIGNRGLANTGSNSNDKFCNIYDMVANTREWTTEYTTCVDSYSYPCVERGGRFYGGSECPAYRSCSAIFVTGSNVSFRLICYVK